MGKSSPPFFDPRLLTSIIPTEIAWWDETHPDTKIGMDKSNKVNNEEVQVRFPRNKDEKMARISKVNTGKIQMYACA